MFTIPRNILIVLGFVVVLIPHLGFPQTWDTVFFTVIGLAIMFLVFMSRPADQQKEKEAPIASDKHRMETMEVVDRMPQTLDVDHIETAEEANVRIERETILDAGYSVPPLVTETTIEQRVLVTKKRRKNPRIDPETFSGVDG